MIRLFLPSSTKIPRQTMLLSSQSWQIEKLADLIGVDIERIRNCFLNELGFPTFRPKRYQVRHCPSCAALGYHCTLFNLPVMKYCPWHKIPLSEGCARCADSIGTIRSSDEEKRCCDFFSYYLIDFHNQAGVQVNRVGPLLAKEIEASCEKIVSWWRSLSDASGRTQALIDPLATDGTETPFYRAYWRAGWANDLAPLPVQWMHHDRLTPSSVLAPLTLTDASTLGDDDEEGRSALSEAYRVVRRAVFRKFMRQHRRCLKEISMMGKFERLALDAPHMCSAAIAYLSWRSAHETLNPQLGASWKGAQPNIIRPVALANFRSRHKTSITRLLYLNFMRIWSAIEEFTVSSGVRIFVTGPVSPCDVPYCQNETEDDVQISVLIPKPEPIAKTSVERCASRRTTRRLMYSAAVAYAASGWNAVPDEELLFEIAHRDHQFRNTYWYVNV
ncbi:hypothetical protein [Paraburkholderia sp. EB58]|uniref:hypothetical protein n=1 Tax=Paraburkholderia sp. EB58 TaxID=3035125 RepID=UPI003D222DD1